jgi:RHS repeat-associated protein
MTLSFRRLFQHRLKKEEKSPEWFVQLAKPITTMKTTSGSVTDYYGNFIYADNQLITIFAGDVRVAPVNVGNSTYWKYEYSMKDHTSTPLSTGLGNTRVVFAAHSHGQPELLQQTSYYPGACPEQFGSMTLQQQNFYSQNATENKYLYNSKELQDDQLAGNTLDWYDYGARFYDATLGRWHVVDPLAAQRLWVSPYNFVQNNPINRIDPDGRLDDWVESADGKIYWDDNAISQETTKEGEKYLGKNVIVATHNRDEEGNEIINSAKFELYSSENKEGPSATVYGNTVPAKVEGREFSTLAEGLYAADFAARISKPSELAVFISVLGEKDFSKKGILPNTEGGIMKGIFLHSGNPNEATLISNKVVGPQWSEGCQTTGSGIGSLSKHNEFMNAVCEKFQGVYYLRGE